jgi:hypothetical protein
VSDELRQLDEFLDDIFTAQDRMTNIEIQRSAIAADLPADLMTRIDALPEGMYTQDEASEAFRTI